jgi:hypothetical protein
MPTDEECRPWSEINLALAKKKITREEFIRRRRELDLSHGWEYDEVDAHHTAAIILGEI